MHRIAIVLLFLASVACFSGLRAPCASQPPEKAALADPDRVAAWIKDLETLTQNLPKKHKHAFFKIKKLEFEEAAEKVRKRIPELKDHEILVEFVKLAALLGDEHTEVGAGPNATPFRRYPLEIVWLGDEVYIAAAREDQKELLRAKIAAIGELPLGKVLERLAPLSASANASGAKQAALYWLLSAEALHAVGVVEDMEKAQFSVVDDTGKKRTFVLTPAPVKSETKFVYAVDPQSKDLAFSRRLPRDRYGHTWLDDSKTLYCWYDACADLPERPVKQWSSETLKEIDERKPERVVIDLRRNGGGSSSLLKPLLDGLVDRDAVNQEGKLFVLIGRRTFSSAMMNALEFRERTMAVLLGLPTGGSPNHYGEVRSFPLPHSKWQVYYSTKYFQLTDDGAKTVKPDVQVEETAADYFAGRDTVLEAAIRYKP
jgi:hypothetical protein